MEHLFSITLEIEFIGKNEKKEEEEAKERVRSALYVCELNSDTSLGELDPYN